MDSKKRYEMLLNCIQYNSVNNPVCRERAIRTSLVSHGDLEVDEYESSLKAAENRLEIVHACGYVCYPVSREMATEAIQYVSNEVSDPSPFVAKMNVLIESEL